jgi:23S rRNA (pseudouridine1915-N3)-methyltransferase
MKIEVISIGKPNDKIYAAAIDEFSKRINRYHAFELIALNSKAKPTASMEQQLQAEMQQVENLLQSTDLLIVLDDKGKSLSTLKLATEFERMLASSKKRIILLIGGAYGIHPVLKQKAELCLSLSALTFPHQLVRLILAEQLYRVFSVHKGEKYHHED